MVRAAMSGAPPGEVGETSRTGRAGYCAHAAAAQARTTAATTRRKPVTSPLALSAPATPADVAPW